MKRLINADEAIDHFRRIIDATNTGSGYDEGFIDALEFCISTLSTMPAAERWIPCSERMPGQGQEVICQCRASIIKVLKLDADGDWYQDANHCYMGGFVIAWMPLPKPYGKEDEK